MNNFSKMTNRFNTNSMKWDVFKNELPLWVADMDFETAPEIVEVLQKKLDLKIYGYTTIPDEYYQAVIQWWRTRHQFIIEKEWILFCTGVIPAISSIVRKITAVGDNVLIQAPVYNVFYNSILNNQRNVLSSDLVFENGSYSIDFSDLEQKLSDEKTTLMILCNPHNPIGKVWQKETLKRIGDLCVKYNVTILSDEIHCDLVHTGYRYTPLASISTEIAEQTITCVAPTKTFNLAGIQTASIIIRNEELRKKVDRGINTDEVAEPNAFAMEATIAAFTKGEKWLDALHQYLGENKQIVEKFIHNEIPELSVLPSEATYLLWLNCEQLTDDSADFADFIRRETGLYLSAGTVFGGNGSVFLRLNYACPQERLKDALERLKIAVKTTKSNNQRSKKERVNMKKVVKLKISFDSAEIIAGIYHNQTSEAFLDSLPITTVFEDFIGKEKISYLSGKYPVDRMGKSIVPSEGDIMYYVPWGNLAIFYTKGHSINKDLVPIAKIESGFTHLKHIDSASRVLIEQIQPD